MVATDAGRFPAARIAGRLQMIEDRRDLSDALLGNGAVYVPNDHGERVSALCRLGANGTVLVRRDLVSRGSSEQAWCRGVGLCTAGDWGSSNPTFTLSCGSCGATSYTSSGVPRFDGMLLSPLAFAAR